MLSIILSCVTEVRYVMVEGGGSVIAAFFLAHNYLSEQFGNYVKYGICQVSILRDSRRYAQPILETVNSRLEAFIHELSIVCPSFVHRLSIVYTRPFEVNLRKMLNSLMNITQV